MSRYKLRGENNLFAGEWAMEGICKFSKGGRRIGMNKRHIEYKVCICGGVPCAESLLRGSRSGREVAETRPVRFGCCAAARDWYTAVSAAARVSCHYRCRNVSISVTVVITNPQPEQQYSYLILAVIQMAQRKGRRATCLSTRFDSR